MQTWFIWNCYTIVIIYLSTYYLPFLCRILYVFDVSLFPLYHPEINTNTWWITYVWALNIHVINYFTSFCWLSFINQKLIRIIPGLLYYTHIYIIHIIYFSFIFLVLKMFTNRSFVLLDRKNECNIYEQ